MLFGIKFRDVNNDTCTKVRFLLYVTMIVVAWTKCSYAAISTILHFIYLNFVFFNYHLSEMTFGVSFLPSTPTLSPSL